jgi:hypothetical protein
MAESVLMGAGIGAGVNMLRGKDPLQGAVMGGAAGGAFGAGGVGAGAGGAGAGGTVVSQGPAHLGTAVATNTGAVAPHLVSETANSGLLSSLGNASDVFKSGQGLLQDTFGISPEQQNMEMLKFGIDKMTPEQQQQIQHANLAQVAGNPNAVGGGVNSVGPTEQQISMGGSPYPNFRQIKIGG